MLHAPASSATLDLVSLRGEAETRCCHPSCLSGLGFICGQIEGDRCQGQHASCCWECFTTPALQQTANTRLSPLHLLPEPSGSDNYPSNILLCRLSISFLHKLSFSPFPPSVCFSSSASRSQTHYSPPTGTAPNGGGWG